MYAKALALAMLSSTTLASQFYQPVHYDFGAMLRRGEAIAKRQGYYPTTTPCGSGDTCEEACGAGKQQCPSESGLYCFDPKLSACCPDNSGNACDNGYFCTTDGKSNTYCCPDGMDLVSCAKAYDLTVSLIRQSSTGSLPTGTGSVSVPASTTPIHITSYPTASATIVYPTTNGTFTTSSPPEFTGGAAKAAGAGMAVLAGAAGLAGLL